jgi:hypothetical protein
MDSPPTTSFKKVITKEKPLLKRCRKCSKRHEFECPKKCDRCDRNTHEMSDCYAKTDLAGNPLDDD